ncbi:MAG: hypothetical protein KBS66_00575 [Eubacterium sp.]|nr:hypothetical protein [Candidatus Colimonas fimequi]
MLTIANENAQQIRTPFEVHCTLVSRDNIVLNTSVPIFTDVKLSDSNLYQMLANDSIEMRRLADLSNGGFRADGSASFYDGNRQGSEEDGKLGVRTTLGGNVVINVTSATVINSLTLTFTEGSGTVTAGGTVYATAPLLVIPVNATSITLTIQADENTRLSLASLIAGLVMEFNNENLISCNLALRSDLNIIEPKLEVSEIEINAYYPNDIAEVISNVGDNTPITYYAGYPGDYSDIRTFYLAEKATQQDNVIKIKGVDAADRLDAYTFPYTAIQSQNNTAAADIYARLVTAVEAALGREIKVNKQVTPGNYGLNTTMHFIVWHEMTARDMISTIMNLCRLESETEDFWPVFVDAGIPTISWSKPVAKWDIYEEDCAEIEEAWDRNINRIISDEGDYGLITDLSVQGNAQIDDVSVEPNQINSYNFEGYVYQPSVSNYRSIVQATAKAITWIAGGGENSLIYGRA